MGHLFVPAALVLWVGVVVVRTLAASEPAPAVQADSPRAVAPSGQSNTGSQELQAPEPGGR